MSTEPWLAALRLDATPGLGLRRCQVLTQALGGCQEVLDAPDGLLRDVLGVRLWSLLRTAPPDWASRVQQVRAWLRAAPEGLRHAVLPWGAPASTHLPLNRQLPQLLRLTRAHRSPEPAQHPLQDSLQFLIEMIKIHWLFDKS